MNCSYCGAPRPLHADDCPIKPKHGETFDLEKAKRLGADLVQDCGLTPERLRELFPPPPRMSDREIQIAQTKKRSIYWKGER